METLEPKTNLGASYGFVCHPIFCRLCHFYVLQVGMVGELIPFHGAAAHGSWLRLVSCSASVKVEDDDSGAGQQHLPLSLTW